MKAATNHEMLPKTLPSAVCRQMVGCGKVNCRCARGELHTAYYRFWREDGKLKKRYVRRDDLKAVQQACITYKSREAIFRAMTRGPAAEYTKAEQRAILRSALGEQAYSPVGRKMIRRLTR